MKKLMSYTLIALLATIAVSTAAPDKDEMMAKEKAAWQAFKMLKPSRNWSITTSWVFTPRASTG